MCTASTPTRAGASTLRASGSSRAARTAAESTMCHLRGRGARCCAAALDEVAHRALTERELRVGMRGDDLDLTGLGARLGRDETHQVRETDVVPVRPRDE